MKIELLNSRCQVIVGVVGQKLYVQVQITNINLYDVLIRILRDLKLILLSFKKKKFF